MTEAKVAPYVGAWIETIPTFSLVPSVKSHPTWVRGLKPNQLINSVVAPFVAPYVGAWIETGEAPRARAVLSSHPTWVRGLKPAYLYFLYICSKVAPYVGAWIETTSLFYLCTV